MTRPCGLCDAFADGLAFLAREERAKLVGASKYLGADLIQDVEPLLDARGGPG
jgi:hypothetical protein